MEEIYTAYVKRTDNPRMGRPTKAPRDINLQIRLSKSENDILERCVRATGKTKTDILVKGLALVYKELNK